MKLMPDALPKNQTRRPLDYEYWTVEELREFGAQLQLPNARQKSRGELLEILDVKLPGRWGSQA